MFEGKKTNALMRHIRNNHYLDIEGSKEKRELLCMGYYHGYKGLLFYTKSENKIHYTKFSQVYALYQFDVTLKNILYPHLMLIETALKNITIEAIIKSGTVNNMEIEHIIKNKLTHYDDFKKNSPKQKKQHQKKLRLKSKIHQQVQYAYGKRDSLTYHVENGKGIPLWVIFEFIPMGIFADFLQNLSNNDKLEISKLIRMDVPSANATGKLIPDIVYTLKDLRNAVAHNNIIFDLRFRPPRTQVNSNIKKIISNKVKIPENFTNFNSITDYFILIIMMRKKLGAGPRELKKEVSKFKDVFKSASEDLNNVTVTENRGQEKKIMEKLKGTYFTRKMELLDDYLSRRP